MRWLACITLTLCLVGPARAASVLLDKIISGFASPESVVVEGPHVFVSNVGEKLEPFAKDGDGFISKLDREGYVRAYHWLPKTGTLNAPKGMVALNGVLYVADIDRVLGYRIVDGKQVFHLDLSPTGANFLNAFAAWTNHRLLLSATHLNKVFIIHTLHPGYEELKFDVPPQGPNGMKVHGNKLIVVEWGTDNQPNGKVRLYRLKGDRATQIKAYDLKPPGYFDGVVDLGGRRWLISNWVKFKPAGVLQLLDTRLGSDSIVNPALHIGGPADMTLDGNTLWVPAMMEGKVYKLTFSP